MTTIIQCMYLFDRRELLCVCDEVWGGGEGSGGRPGAGQGVGVEGSCGGGVSAVVRLQTPPLQGQVILFMGYSPWGQFAAELSDFTGRKPWTIVRRFDRN